MWKARILRAGAFVALTTLTMTASVASADASSNPPRGSVALRVRVGETATLDVGFARGLQCDDVDIIRPELRGESPTTNRFYVTGVRPGATLCRVGMRPGPTILVRIRVEP